MICPLNARGAVSAARECLGGERGTGPDAHIDRIRERVCRAARARPVQNAAAGGGGMSAVEAATGRVSAACPAMRWLGGRG